MLFHDVPTALLEGGTLLFLFVELFMLKRRVAVHGITLGRFGPCSKELRRFYLKYIFKGIPPQLVWTQRVYIRRFYYFKYKLSYKFSCFTVPPAALARLSTE
jgi:hypothetical protein